MFGTVKFRNEFAFLDNGIAAQTIATGTTSGSAMQLGGLSPLRRMVHILEIASGSASNTVAMYLATATASNGSMTSLSQTSQIVSITASGKQYLVLDTRNEAFQDLGTNALWIKPVIVVSSGSTCPIALTTLGYLSGSEPASNFDASAGFFSAVKEVDFF